MDEPCSSITEEDTDKLFELIRELKKTGVTVIYIDHRIENFKKIGDRVTVLRDGQYIGTLDMESATREEIIRMMVGRKLSEIFHKTSAPEDEILFEIKNYSNKKLKDVSFSVRKGEVFGLAGLVGAGRTETVEAIFGLDPIAPDAQTLIHGKSVSIKNPRSAIKNGIAFVPEDRKIKGFIPARSINFNLVLAKIMQIGKGPLVNTKLERKLANQQRENLDVRTLSDNAHVRELSGGNQQKIVLGKWLMRDDVELLLLDEPTRGIDVGVKMEIYQLIDKLANAGKSIIVVTSEMPELINMCDRIAVLSEGRITATLDRDEFSQEKIMQHCI
jgi:ABC-type sugar transport system ATPase subunit